MNINELKVSIIISIIVIVIVNIIIIIIISSIITINQHLGRTYGQVQLPSIIILRFN